MLHMDSILKMKPFAGLWNNLVEIQVPFVYCCGVTGSQYVVLLWPNSYKDFYEDFENYSCCLLKVRDKRSSNYLLPHEQGNWKQEEKLA